MASHVVVPPSLLHVVSEKSGTMSDFSDAVAFPFFAILSNDYFSRGFLKWNKGKLSDKQKLIMTVRIK